MAVAAASFCGMLVGGIVGGHLYAHSGRRLLRFCAGTCVLRWVAERMAKENFFQNLYNSVMLRSGILAFIEGPVAAFILRCRCVPCVMIFAFPAIMGPAPEGLALVLLLLLLLAAAFVSTLPTANVGAVLLNVNPSEVRVY